MTRQRREYMARHDVPRGLSRELLDNLGGSQFKISDPLYVWNVYPRDDSEYDLGEDDNRFYRVYGDTFIGTAIELEYDSPNDILSSITLGYAGTIQDNGSISVPYMLIQTPTPGTGEMGQIGLDAQGDDNDTWLYLKGHAGATIATIELYVGTSVSAQYTFYNGYAQFDEPLHIADNLVHAGDTDTYLGFTTDKAAFTVGNVVMIELTKTTQDIVHINSANADVDFQVDTAGGDESLFVEGSSGEVHHGFGTRLIGNVIIGTDASPPSDVMLDVRNLTVDTTTSEMGIHNRQTKTAGATDHDDYMYGIYSNIILNQAGGEISNFFSLVGIARVTDGNVGDTSNSRNAQAIRAVADLDGGKVWGGAYGVEVIVDQEAGNEVTGNMYGLHIDVDADGTVGTSVYMIYLNEGSNVDYGIYQNGSAINRFGGNLGIGVDPSSARLHVNQSGAAAAIPVLHLEQDDISEEFMRFTGQAASAVLTQSLVDVGDVASFTPVGYAKINVQDEGNQITDGPYYVEFGTLS